MKYKLHYIIKTLGIRKINLGCGYEHFPQGWLNIGLFDEKDISYAQIKKINDAYVLHFDLTNELPIEAGSIEYIYSSHFLEHIQFQQAIDLFKRLKKSLVKGGVVKLEVPDLNLWICKYYENDEKFFKNFYRLIKSFPNFKTKGEIFAGQIFGYGHKWAYDSDSLRDLLQRAGFANITQKKYGDSSIFKIEPPESLRKIRKIETICFEAIK
ncbi:MAG TPA: methyltransferase domain-containing protein [Candidatus Babeliales bacterium]|nr:methyltransferase domain-containing protein [Candidatus Babeliales bacterium]